MRLVLFTLLLFLLPFAIHAQYQDCFNALNIKTKDSIVVNSVKGFGDLKEEYESECTSFLQFFENNSRWFSFTPVQSGNFYFTVKPHLQTNDMDFYLFKSDSGDCSPLTSLRCNSSSCVGEFGYTGIAPNDIDLFEDNNCDNTTC